jgi:hypothetical protein
MARIYIRQTLAVCLVKIRVVAFNLRGIKNIVAKRPTSTRPPTKDKVVLIAVSGTPRVRCLGRHNDLCTILSTVFFADKIVHSFFYSGKRAIFERSPHTEFLIFLAANHAVL